MDDLLEDLVSGKLDAASDAIDEDEGADALVEAEQAVVAHYPAAGAEKVLLVLPAPALRNDLSGMRSVGCVCVMGLNDRCLRLLHGLDGIQGMHHEVTESGSGTSRQQRYKK